MSTKLSTLALLFLPLLGCVEEIDLELPEVAPQLVVLSNFTTDQELQVSVSRTRSAVSDEVGTFLYYTDADVRLWHGLDEIDRLEVVFPEDETQPPYYVTDGFEPLVGVLYTIRVNVAGFEEVVATSMIPRPVAIDAVGLSTKISGTGTEDESELQFEVQVRFTDPPGERNYYHLRFFQELTRYRIEGNDTIVNPATTVRRLLQVRGLSDRLPYLTSEDGRGVLIQDDGLDGLVSEFVFSGLLRFNSQLYLPGNFVVELRSVSKEYYDFHASVARQLNTNGPFSTGLDLNDNIDNGVGSFAGFSTNTSSVVVPR